MLTRYQTNYVIDRQTDEVRCHRAVYRWDGGVRLNEIAHGIAATFADAQRCTSDAVADVEGGTD